jgi:hypothetical protein
MTVKVLNWVYISQVGTSVIFAMHAVITLGTWACTKGCRLNDALSVPTIPLNRLQKKGHDGTGAGEARSRAAILGMLPLHRESGRRV